MKFSVGDAVWMRQTAEEGTIVSFLSATIYEVDVAGIRFPVFADQLEHPYLRRFQQPGFRKVAEEVPIPVPEKVKPQRLPRGAYLSFMPVYGTEQLVDEMVGVKVHLLNELPETLRFEYELRSAQKQAVFALSGLLSPYSNLYVHTIPWELLAAQPRFHWALQPTYGGRVGPQENGTVCLRARQLIQRIRQLEESGAPLFSELLVDHFIETAPLPLPEIKGSGTIDKLPHVPEFSPVIDLHAYVLLPDAADYPPAEVFRIQLDTLHTFLQEAIAHQETNLTVVHGLGNGMLRQAVHEILNHMPAVKRLSQDWHPQYGFGATQVVLRK
ncbi:MAG: hypothetical protein EOP52_11995 [Sphingobacteriales bacterium]|nr:MAG: hypothetical protein EOP52_11995 [Sphingobacteriales bacterium]